MSSDNNKQIHNNCTENKTSPGSIRQLSKVRFYHFGGFCYTAGMESMCERERVIEKKRNGKQDEWCPKGSDAFIDSGKLCGEWQGK